MIRSIKLGPNSKRRETFGGRLDGPPWTRRDLARTPDPRNKIKTIEDLNRCLWLSRPKGSMKPYQPRGDNENQ